MSLNCQILPGSVAMYILLLTEKSPSCFCLKVISNEIPKTTVQKVIAMSFLNIPRLCFNPTNDLRTIWNHHSIHDCSWKNAIDSGIRVYSSLFTTKSERFITNKFIGPPIRFFTIRLQRGINDSKNVKKRGKHGIISLLPYVSYSPF